MNKLLDFNVKFFKVNSKDNLGFVTINNKNYPIEFLYSDIGSHNGIQFNCEIDKINEKKINNFCIELSDLVRKHFKEIPSIL